MQLTASHVYGLMAEFDDPTSLVPATERAHDAGYRRMDAYSPFPIEELHEALGSHHTRLPLIVLIGGLVGCLGGYALAVLGVGDRLSAQRRRQAAPQLAGVHPGDVRVHDSRRRRCRRVLGMLALNGLPMPYHPVFNVPRFALASRNRFFLCIEATDPKFDLEATRAFPRDAEPAGGVDRCATETTRRCNAEHRGALQ